MYRGAAEQPQQRSAKKDDGGNGFPRMLGRAAKENQKDCQGDSVAEQVGEVGMEKGGAGDADESGQVSRNDAVLRQWNGQDPIDGVDDPKDRDKPSGAIEVRANLLHTERLVMDRARKQCTQRCT